MNSMFSVKKIMLVTGLASLTCQPQAWAMDDFDSLDTAASARLPVSPEHELKDPQEKTPDSATQLRREQAKNKKLKAQKAAAQAENKKLKAQLAALQAAQSALAPTPIISQVYKDTVKKTCKKTERNLKKALRLKKKKRSHRPYSHRSDGLSLRSVLRS